MARTLPLIPLLLAAVAVLFLAPAPASAQTAVICGPPATCTFIGGTLNRCTEQWAYTVSAYVNTLTSMTGAATACTVTGNTQTRTFAARRPTAAATTGGCIFAGQFGIGGGLNYNYSCTIDENSGLPVELMEFEVEDGSEDEAEKSS